MADRTRARSALLALDPATNRETWVRIGMAAKAAGLTLEEWTEWSRPAPNFGSDRECEAVWRSLDDGAIQAGTLFYLAHSQGWKDPGRTRQNGARAIAAPWQSGNARPAPTRLQTTLARPALAAGEFWDACLPANAEHPYILAKGGHPGGLRVAPSKGAPQIAGTSVAGWLVVPVRALSGELRTLQLIPPPGTGRKLNLPGHAFADGLHVIGDATSAARIFIVEGIGQGWACWNATGDAAAVTFGAGRMGAVAVALRRAFPDKPLVLVPDRGKEPEAEAIALKLCARYARLPEGKPPNYDAGDYAREHGADELAQLLDAPDTPETRYRLRAAADLLNAPPLRWLVRGVLPAQGLACVYGASGSGKSFLAIDLCTAVASGRRWFGHRVNAAPVVYVALEGEAGFGQRVKAWQVHHGTPPPEALRFVMQGFDLRNPEDVNSLTRAVKASDGAGGLLVIDTLNRAASGADENTSRDMGEIINASKALQSQLGGLVLMVHHSGKDQSRGLRGHSSLIAALDASIEVLRTDARREWRIDKAKDNADNAGQAFRLQVVGLGRDDDGEPVSSCVVVPDESERAIRRTLPPKSGTQKVVLDALGDTLRREGLLAPPKAPAGLPRGCPALPLESAIDRIRERLACDPKRRTERTQAALTALQAKGLVCVDAGWIWRV